MRDFEYKRLNERGLATNDSVRVKVVLFDDETRAKLRRAISDFFDEWFNNLITLMIWGGLIGYWIGCYYN